VSDVIGVDLGGTKIAVARLAGRRLSTSTIRPTELSDSDTLIDQLVEIITSARDERLDAVGIGVPSIVEFATGRVVSSTNIPLADVPLREVLGERLGVPAFIDNDATVAALAEAHDEDLKMVARDLVMITVGTGVGGGLVLGGRIYRGATGGAGEIGHTLVGIDLSDSVPEAGRFPQPGSLEGVAAGHALDHLAASFAEEYPDSALGRLRAAGRAVTGVEAVDAAHAGDAQAARLVELDRHRQRHQHLRPAGGRHRGWRRPRRRSAAGARETDGERLHSPGARPRHHHPGRPPRRPRRRPGRRPARRLRDRRCAVAARRGVHVGLGGRVRNGERMIVACGFDHAGYVLRDRLLGVIEGAGHEILDFGTDRPEPVDYPDKALEVGHAVASGRAQRGIIVCGSGAGVSVAAAKIHGVRAATIHDTYTAHQGVEHDDVNVLCLGGRVIGVEVAAQIVLAFLQAEVSYEERHVRRRAQVDEIERTGGDIAFGAGG
jgi:glucokinase